MFYIVELFKQCWFILLPDYALVSDKNFDRFSHLFLMLFEKVPDVVVKPTHNAKTNAGLYHLFTSFRIEIPKSVVFYNFWYLLL